MLLPPDLPQGAVTIDLEQVLDLQSDNVLVFIMIIDHGSFSCVVPSTTTSLVFAGATTPAEW